MQVNNNSNLIHRLLKSLKVQHIQVKIMLIKAINRICSIHDHYLTTSDTHQDRYRKGVNR